MMYEIRWWLIAAVGLCLFAATFISGAELGELAAIAKFKCVR